MPKRSSKDDTNVTAFDVVRQATGDDDVTGPEILAELIAELRTGIEEDASDADIALRLWPRLSRLIALAGGEQAEEIQAGLQRWLEERQGSVAAEMGRKGGKKGGKARAKNLSPERRSEIARKAAEARWEKPKGE